MSSIWFQLCCSLWFARIHMCGHMGFRAQHYNMSNHIDHANRTNRIDIMVIHRIVNAFLIHRLCGLAIKCLTYSRMGGTYGDWMWLYLQHHQWIAYVSRCACTLLYMRWRWYGMRMISNRWVDTMGSCAQYHNKDIPQEQSNALVISAVDNTTTCYNGQSNLPMHWFQYYSWAFW